MEVARDIESKFVERGDKAEEPGKEGADGDGGDTVPEEEHQDAAAGDAALFPGDFGMEQIGKDGGEGVGDDTVEPEQLVGIHDDSGEKGVDGEVEEGKNGADDGKFADAGGGLGVGFWGFLLGVHGIIIA